MSIGKMKLRDLSMKALFQFDFYPNPDLDRQTRVFLEQQPGLQEEDIQLIADRMKMIYGKVAEIDEMIESRVEGWTLKRMSRVDLSIIRLAVYEMKFDTEVPASLAINEAVELAKTYGGDESPKFVNGVLSKLMD